MNVTHFTTETRGGAGVAALRLHSMMQVKGLNSRLYFRDGARTEGNRIADRRKTSLFWRNVASVTTGIHWKRSVGGRGLFTNPKWIYGSRLTDFGPLPQVVHLHWVSRWIDQPSFFESIPNGLPVVWSLHDMNPLTGGCHHALDCDRFTTHCQLCPSLRRPGAHDASWRNFRTKSQLYSRLNLHIVGNSSWTTQQAKRSALMRNAASIQTISLGVDPTEYAPIEKGCARESLRIGPDEFVIGFACADLADHNKGLAVLLEAISDLSRTCHPTLVVFGAGKIPLLSDRVRVIQLGDVSSSAIQCIAYSAADVFVMPSRVESFGLTALEAMACGTPVVAFRTGGLLDLVLHGQTGLLEDEVGSAAGLAAAIKWMYDHPAERVGMGTASRQRVENHFAVELMADRYVELYRSVLAR